MKDGQAVGRQVGGGGAGERRRGKQVALRMHRKTSLGKYACPLLFWSCEHNILVGEDSQ